MPKCSLSYTCEFDTPEEMSAFVLRMNAAASAHGQTATPGTAAATRAAAPAAPTPAAATPPAPAAAKPAPAKAATKAATPPAPPAAKPAKAPTPAPASSGELTEPMIRAMMGEVKEKCGTEKAKELILAHNPEGTAPEDSKLANVPPESYAALAADAKAALEALNGEQSGDADL